MHELLLVPPSKELEPTAIDFRQEHFDHNQMFINGSALWDTIRSYDDWLQQINRNSDKKTVQSDWVVSSTFFAVRQSDSRIVGMIDVRHSLNPFLKEYGGHIGFDVRPTERKKGYATAMLQLALDYSQQLRLRKVMLCCYANNAASMKTIIKCGGVLEKEKLYTDGKPMQVYWIAI
jgi:predicted acetyltransferase